MTNEIIKAAHTSAYAGHNGIHATKARIGNSYFWPGMAGDIVKFITTCHTCQISKSRAANKAPLNSYSVLDHPNVRVHMDLMGPLKTSHSGKKYIIVITDAFTKYTEIGAIPDKSAEVVANAFYTLWITNHGTPEQLVTDNGKEFINEVMTTLLRLLNVKKLNISPFHPASNSSAESFNRTIIKYLRTALENRTLDWETHLPSLKLAYNTRVHQSTQFSPFFLTYLHDRTTPVLRYRQTSNLLQ